MYEICGNKKAVDNDIEIDTYGRDLSGFAAMKVEAGTTGYCGGDAEHGGRTYFAIRDMGGTAINIHPFRKGAGYGECEGFEVTLAGDDELRNIIRALKFITQVLEEESDPEKRFSDK